MTPDISYLLYWDDDSIPIEGSMTLGNHLDNDVVVPGEDVSDYHARLDLSDRGPVIIPLGNATVSVNGHEAAAPVQLMIGDVVGIGQATMQIGIETESLTEADSWSLHAEAGDTSYPVAGEVSVGRADSADISLRDEHISRFHARLVEKHNVVWIQDLHSANGTRINDAPLVGGARLFHGDFVAFDKLRFQLIGKGGDLTPVKTFVDPLRGTTSQPPAKQADTTEFAPVEEQAPAPVEIPELSETGAFLLGISETVDGQVFRVGIGECLIGRGEHCHVVLRDNTVSNEHAQMTVRPDGVTITNLNSTNGTRINGDDITTAKLEDGDVVRLGKVSLVFKDIPSGSIEAYPLLNRLSAWTLGGVSIGAALLLLLMIL